MEIVTIEAATFMEMNNALETLLKRVCGICGGASQSMDDWIDNQEACMMRDISPGKLLALRRKRAIPYSHIDRKVYYKRQDIIRFMEDTIHLVNI